MSAAGLWAIVATHAANQLAHCQTGYSQLFTDQMSVCEPRSPSGADVQAAQPPPLKF